MKSVPAVPQASVGRQVSGQPGSPGNLDHVAHLSPKTLGMWGEPLHLLIVSYSSSPEFVGVILSAL